LSSSRLAPYHGRAEVSVRHVEQSPRDHVGLNLGGACEMLRMRASQKWARLKTQRQSRCCGS